MNLNEIQCELLTKENLKLIDNVLEELQIDSLRLKAFLEYPQNLAFIAKCNEEVTGFIYGYSLMSLNSNPQLFIYSVDVLSKFQNKGIGSKLFKYAVDFSRENGFSECYVITDKGNKRACRIYEKSGGKNDYEDEIVYVIKNKKIV
jgi:ribosomal protein S18 acetylase RimI-like enzyme